MSYPADTSIAPNCLEAFTFAEYFAGIGLVRMGLEDFNWRAIFANDISEKKYQIYKDFFPDAYMHYSVDDIFDLTLEQIPSTLLATCSFPCVDLSLAGNMEGIRGKHSSAFWGFTSLLHRQGSDAPSLVLVENVHGWLHSNGGKDFRLTVEALNKLGYICDAFALDALRFTPQSRPRIFLIGSKFKSPEPIDKLLVRPKSLLPQQLAKSIRSNQDLKWFYQDLPEPPALNSSGLSEIIETMADDDVRWWSDPEVKRHLEMMAPIHRNRVETLASNSQYSYRTFFRRIRSGKQRVEVRPNDTAGCLRTAAGGSGKQFVIRAGNNLVKMRTMTPREYARLQGVPDKFVIKTNGVQALTGFGDAVCVPVIRWIAQNSLNRLAQEALSQNVQTSAFNRHVYYQMRRDMKSGQVSFLETPKTSET
jgi:DNA (cytosine-5)-methyltransferase 1